MLIKKKQEENKIIILNVSITPIEKSIGTQCVHFFVLHTCIKSHQPRDNNKIVMTTISSILTSITYPEKLQYGRSSDAGFIIGISNQLSKICRK